MQCSGLVNSTHEECMDTGASHLQEFVNALRNTLVNGTGPRDLLAQRTDMAAFLWINQALLGG